MRRWSRYSTPSPACCQANRSWPSLVGRDLAGGANLLITTDRSPMPARPTSQPPLLEVSEQAARGSVAKTFADIRRVLGIRMVVLIYRALAASPGRLEHIWDTWRPISPPPKRSATRHRSIHRDRRGRAAATSDLAAAGIDPALLASTLDGFNRANRLNLVGSLPCLWEPPASPTPSPTQRHP